MNRQELEDRMDGPTSVQVRKLTLRRARIPVLCEWIAFFPRLNAKAPSVRILYNTGLSVQMFADFSRLPAPAMVEGDVTSRLGESTLSIWRIANPSASWSGIKVESVGLYARVQEKITEST